MKIRRWSWIYLALSTTAEIVYITGNAVAGLQALLNQLEALQNPIQIVVPATIAMSPSLSTATTFAPATTSAAVVYTAITNSNGMLELPGLLLPQVVPNNKVQAVLPTTTTSLSIATSRPDIVTPTGTTFVASTKDVTSSMGDTSTIPSVSTATVSMASTSTITILHELPPPASETTTLAYDMHAVTPSPSIVIATAVSTSATRTTSTRTSFSTIFFTITVPASSSIVPLSTSESTITMTTTMTVTVDYPIHTNEVVHTYNASMTNLSPYATSSGAQLPGSAAHTASPTVMFSGIGAVPTYIGVPSSNSTNSTVSAKSAERSTAVKTVATVGGVLGAGVISAVVVLGLLARRRTRRKRMIASQDNDNDVYRSHRPQGRRRRKRDRLMSIFGIRVSYQSRSDSPYGFSISHPTPVNKGSLDLPRMHDRLEKQEARLTRQKRETSRHARPASLVSSRSSVYTTNQKIPFKLGSPVRMVQQLDRPQSDSLSYRIPSWRYKDPLPSKPLQDTKPLLIAKKQSAHGLQTSHFSLASDYSEFGPYMSRQLPGRKPATTSNEPLPVWQVGIAQPPRNFSRPHSSFTAGTSVSQAQDFCQQNIVHADGPARQQILPAKTWAMHNNDANDEIKPQDGRKTQVYKLLKRALGR